MKICGLTRPEDAAAAVSAGADLVGFVFVPGTPRAVTAGGAAWISEIDGAETAGVFRDAPLEEVLRIRELLRLDWVQLHGGEPDEWLERLGPKVIRAVRIDAEPDWERLRRIAGSCLPLIDPGGGSGRTFDWTFLSERPVGLRLGLAGGLSPANVAAAVRTVRPALVDVSSGVEARPGVKDHGRVRAFVRKAREAERGTMIGHGRED